MVSKSQALENCTPLHLAAWLGNHAEVVRLLLAHDGVQANAAVGLHDYVPPAANVQMSGEVSWRHLPPLRVRLGLAAVPQGRHRAAPGRAGEPPGCGHGAAGLGQDGRQRRGRGWQDGVAPRGGRSEVNSLDGCGRSPLQVAVELGRHRELGVLLAEPRVNLNLATGCDGDTALTLAFKLGRRDMVKELLGQPRLRANTRNWDNKTMVHYLWDSLRSDQQLKDDDHFHLDCTELLMGRGDVQRYLQGLATDRQMFHNSTNAFLVGAAVVAAATFAGFLNPPPRPPNHHHHHRCRSSQVLLH